MERRFLMLDELYIVSVRFKKAGEQCYQLTRRMRELINRYSMADEYENTHYQEQLEKRIQIVDGFITVYTRYLEKKRDRIAELRHELFGDPLPVEQNEDDREAVPASDE
ncbi:hypothetical protein ACF0H5_006708 [Mactra antiquata]